MAIYRTIQLSFWTDEKVLDEFTPEDKYFYLYLFTNPQTNLAGCYQLGWTQTTSQIGYTRDSINHLIERFEKVHKVIKYSKETKEIILLNWHKYNWTTSARFLMPLRKEIENIHNKEFSAISKSLFNEYLWKAKNNPDLSEKELVLLEKIEFFEESELGNIPYVYGTHTTVTVTDNNNININTVINNKDNNKDTINNIINYLNKVLGTKYKSNSKDTVKYINARLNEGYLEEDFFTVIDKMYAKWGNDSKMSQYLRPATLFSPKFESYLNMKDVASRSELDEWSDLLKGEF